MTTLPNFLTSCVYLKPDVRYLVLDFETTNLDYGSALNPENELLLGCWRIVEQDGTTTIKSKRGSEFEFRELLEDIAGVDYVVVQNGKFELQWLKRCGLDLRDVLVFDTMLAEWVILGNRKDNKDLNTLATKYLGRHKEPLVDWMIEKGINPKDIPPSWLEEYCHTDVALTDEIHLKQLEVLKQEKLLHLVHLRNLTCACLADIEFNGLYLDKDRVREEYNRLVAEANDYEKQLIEITGGINFRSTKQVAELLYGKLAFEELTDKRKQPIRTATGKPLTDADSISQLKAKTKEQKLFKELYDKYRQADVLLSKNLDFFNGVCEEYGGLFHGEFNQGRTATGRLSGSGRKLKFRDGTTKGAQFQNLPRQFKRLFTARKEGYVIGECDGSQLEFRTAAGMAQDPVASKEIEDWVDVHSITAEVLTAAGEPTSRQEAKASTFKPLMIAA